MPALVSILALATALLAGCSSSSSDGTSDPLSFYVVSENKIEGGQFIDTADFPKLGYIAAAPDLTVARLEAVVGDISRAQSVAVGEDGQRAAGPWRERPGFHISMHAPEAEKFAVLTEQALGKRVLVMLGDSPISAARIMSPIATGRLFMTFGDNVDSNEIERALKKLVR
jgi:hypothetical protein